MKRKNSNRNALITSIISLLLCVSMLVGTTFAWFTDSVTSGNNIIKSGNLDVAMYWADGTQAVPTEDTGWTDASEGAIFNYQLWEPGYTVVRHIKIVNEGSLALKYQLKIVANGEVSELADVIDVYYTDPAAQVADRTDLTADKKIGTLTEVLDNISETANGTLLANSDPVTLTLALKMQEEAGNDYMNKAIGSDFSVILLATQETNENDSFDNQYDKLAALPGTGSVAAPAEGVSAVEINVLNTNEQKIASVVVPAGAIADNAEAITVEVEETSYKADITVATGLETKAFDVKVTGLKENNDVPVKVTLYLPTGLDPDTVKLYHYDAKIDCTYDPNTGYVTFHSATFSPFTIVYDADSEYKPPVVDSGTERPAATVTEYTEIENIVWGSYGQWSPTPGLEANLEVAYKFTCPEELDENFANWYCDFYVKLDKDLGENQIFLGGNYGSFGWVGFHNGDLTLEANTEIPLLGSVTTNPWTYSEVYQYVGEFICGVGDVNDALAGATFTVMLRLTNPNDTTEYYNVNTITYTFPNATDTTE